MEIRQATYADKPAIFDFLNTAYAGRSEFKFPHRWEWAYENNPFLGEARPPVWIALSPDGRVIGQSAALVEPLIIKKKTYRIGWGVDFYVLPEYRGQGIGTMLQSANNDGNEIFMSLSMAESAANIKSRLGLSELQQVTAFTQILHHDPASVLETMQKRLPGFPFLKKIAPFTAQVLTNRSAPPKFTPLSAGIEIRQETSFTEAYDLLWERLSDAYAALIRRDARYLTWKFRHQPHMRHDIFGAYQKGTLSGYMVLRRSRPPERNAGILVDLFAHPDDNELISALIDHALDRFFKQQVTFVTAGSTVPQICNQLLEKKFKSNKTITPMARAPFQLPKHGWLLGKGDHDWDQFPLA